MFSAPPVTYTRLFRFLLVISLEIRFFAVVVSVVLLSPFSISSLFNKRTCFITFFRRRRCFAVSQLFVSKAVPNKVEGLIRHRHFNSTTHKRTRRTANLVNYIYLNICLSMLYLQSETFDVSRRHLCVRNHARLLTNGAKTNFQHHSLLV